MIKFSAYLSIYNDWSLLRPTLASMKDRIDELVVVDGAHEWMASYLNAIGENPIRSRSEVYDIISASGIPWRSITKLWTNEIEKRIAGYEACTGRYRFRIDADEIIFFDSDNFDRFLSSDYAVAEMDMPIYDSPGYVHAADLNGLLGRQALMFDANRIGAEQHLHHLWLVLPADRLPPPQSSPQVFSDPIAFNAHLSHWRTAVGASQRAAFYTLNWVRANGWPHVAELAGKPLTDLRRIFDFIPPRQFHSALSRGEVANGFFKIIGNVMRPTPLEETQEKSFSCLYDDFMSHTFNLNEAARAERQAYFPGASICFNVSKHNGRRSLLTGAPLVVRADQSISQAKASLHFVRSCEPFMQECAISAEADGQEVLIHVPEILNDNSEVRCVLSMSLWPDESKPYGLFQISSH